jgi:hypothetical protein
VIQRQRGSLPPIFVTATASGCLAWLVVGGLAAFAVLKVFGVL